MIKCSWPDAYDAMAINDGLEIGSFQMQLLRQIEEQALYIIQQEEKLLDQEKRLKALEVYFCMLFHIVFIIFKRLCPAG